MGVFSPVQFQHARLSHVNGPHDFPDTQDMYRPVGPNVTEDEDPKDYQSDPIYHSNDWMKRVFHGGSWDTNSDAPWKQPNLKDFGHTIRKMVPR